MKKILLIFIAFFSAMVCTSAAWPRSKVTVRTMLDASGALTRDDARNITSVSYDNLGNLLRISYGNGNHSSFVYSATGERLKATHVTGLATKAGIAGLAAVPDMFADDEPEKASAVALAAVAGSTEYKYRGPFVYRDGAAEKALFPGGYAFLQGGVAFHFYTSDYLGNVRAVTNASTGVVEQALAYYPYGGIIADLGTGHAFQPYKFGEKELVTANGLNEYDFGARQYYQAVPMFTSPDPSSEKYPWLSPYLYCASDPVNVIDPDGMDIRLLGPDDQSITIKTTLISQEYDLSSLNLGWNGNMVFEGDNILSAALDLVGIFDPSGVADVTNAGLQFNNGEWVNGLISGAGVIPVFGDAFKVFKIPGFVKTFKDMSAGIRKNNRIGKAAETMVTEEIVKEFPGKTVVDQVYIRLQDGGHTVLDNLVLKDKEVLLLNETKYGGAGLSPNQIRFYGGEPGVVVGEKAKNLGIYGLPIKATKNNSRVTKVNPK